MALYSRCMSLDVALDSGDHIGISSTYPHRSTPAHLHDVVRSRSRGGEKRRWVHLPSASTQKFPDSMRVRTSRGVRSTHLTRANEVLTPQSRAQ